MNVAVLAPPENEGVVIPILETLASIGSEAYGLKMRPHWTEADRSHLDSFLFKATHFLVVLSRATLASSWLPFIAGYASAYGRRLTLFRADPACKAPPFMGTVHTLGTLAELAEFYEVERDDWLVFEERRNAKATLLEMGVSFHADAFVENVAAGDVEAVKLFLKGGFTPDVRDRHGVPVLNTAVRSNHIGVVRFLVEAGAPINLLSEDRGYSPLMDAVKKGAAEIRDYLLSLGADPNLTSKDGQNALVIAVGCNDVETARLLLEAGADPDRADKLGLSARKYAQLFHNTDMTALFEGATAPDGAK